MLSFKYIKYDFVAMGLLETKLAPSARRTIKVPARHMDLKGKTASIPSASSQRPSKDQKKPRSNSSGLTIKLSKVVKPSLGKTRIIWLKHTPSHCTCSDAPHRCEEVCSGARALLDAVENEKSGPPQPQTAALPPAEDIAKASIDQGRPRREKCLPARFRS